MARSSSGRSVARAAATGGGATYRGQMPVNWYAALLVIVLVGVGSVAFAKYHYNQTPPVVEPTIGTTWHAGLAFDICGTMESPLAASPSSATGLTTTGDGILKIAPTTSSEAGNNATLGKFASGYSGLTLTNTTVKYPLSTEYKNGEKCAKGTPDAGQVGEVSARSWLLSTKTAKNGELEQTGGNTTVHPADLKLADRQLITVGFVPHNVMLPKPPASPTISGLLQVLAGGSQPVATTTTAPAATPASVPSATTSSVPASTTSTTTAPHSTTTSSTKPPTTTTTK
jgi:hypothetical protein